MCTIVLVLLLEVVVGGRDEEEDLLALQDVVPHRGAAKVDVEVGVALLHGHQAILLDLWCKRYRVTHKNGKTSC